MVHDCKQRRQLTSSKQLRTLQHQQKKLDDERNHKKSLPHKDAAEVAAKVTLKRRKQELAMTQKEAKKQMAHDKRILEKAMKETGTSGKQQLEMLQQKVASE